MVVFSQKYLDDHDVIERYLADQLSEAEREGFEAHFMQHPEIVQQMNRVARFKSALMDLDAAGRLQPLLMPKPARHWRLVLVILAALAALSLLIISRWR
jgi:hypothetical protein